MCNNTAVTIPEVATIDNIKDEIKGVKTFYISFDNKEYAKNLKFKSGQFVMCTVSGAGEFAVSLPPAPESDPFHLSVRAVGKVTNALHDLKAGDKLGIRGPFGNGFPFAELKGRNLVYVAGGIGIIPLRSSIVHALQHKKDFGRVIIVYGARTPEELMYQEDLKKWKSIEGVEAYFTIDNPVPGWNGETGFVHTMIEKAKVPIENSTAFVCGPPIMFNAVIKELTKMGMDEENIISTLERYMKCGIGKCQHCAIGRTLVCTDGPVYTYKQIKTLGEEI
jgi:NAD(P)H-flavin reductase